MAPALLGAHLQLLGLQHQPRDSRGQSREGSSGLGGDATGPDADRAPRTLGRP